MVKVVIVNGKPEVGKTLFQTYCKNTLYNLRWGTGIHSSVEWVKEIATKCGWNGDKNEKNRKFLSDLKKLLTDWDDAVLKNLIDTVDNYQLCKGLDFVIFIDIREPHEIERAKEALNATTVLIRRPEVEKDVYGNASDDNVFDYNYDYVVNNDGDLIKLEEEVQKFVDYLLASDKAYDKF